MQAQRRAIEFDLFSLSNVRIYTSEDTMHTGDIWYLRGTWQRRFGVGPKCSVVIAGLVTWWYKVKVPNADTSWFVAKIPRIKVSWDV